MVLMKSNVIDKCPKCGSDDIECWGNDYGSINGFFTRQCDRVDVFIFSNTNIICCGYNS